jgi:hypothetical protein
MSDYLTRLVERAHPGRQLLRPALPPAFEPTQTGVAVGWHELPEATRRPPLWVDETGVSSPAVTRPEPPRGTGFDGSRSLAASTPAPQRKDNRLADPVLIRETRQVSDPGRLVDRKEVTEPAQGLLSAPTTQPRLASRDEMRPLPAAASFAPIQPAMQVPEPSSHIRLVAPERAPEPSQAILLQSPAQPTLSAGDQTRQRPIAPPRAYSHLSAPPEIHVTIGRIEVRAIPTLVPVPAQKPPPPRTPKVSLDDYLRSRNGACA